MTEKILANRYRLTEQIGMGGMAIVYRAIDLRTGHNVAVKVLRPEYNEDREFIGRFQREAEAASKMTHHNIVNLLDVGMDGENRYLVMEYVQGKTLKTVIQERGKLSAPLACQITIRILSALEHAHRNGIIHRDIKPQNILVHEDGHIKVADFGIARIADSATLTRGDNVMGSVHYFSPEQARGESATAASDIYSTGVVLYEMLTGRVPFDGDNPVAVAMQHLHATPVPIQSLAPDVPPSVVHVCMRALEKNPAMRYQSARDMAADLRTAMEERGERIGFSENELEIRQPKPQIAGEKGKSKGNWKVNRKRIIRITADVLIGLAVLAGIWFGGKAIYDQTIYTVSIPDVYGKDQEEAQDILKKMKLDPVLTFLPNDQVEQNQVFMQNPESGQTARKGDKVALMVCSGPIEHTMPDVTGKTAEEATIILNGMNIVNITRDRIQSSAEKGSVIGQQPEEGTTVTKDQPVILTVSAGQTQVPDLVGMTLEEAENILVRSNLLMVPSIQYKIAPEPKDHGTVAAISPEADSWLAEDAQVQLTIYRDPDQAQTATLKVELKKNDNTQKVRITIQAVQSKMDIDVRYYTITPEDSNVIEETIEIPDNREYTYCVYVGDTLLDNTAKKLNGPNNEESK